MGWIETVRIATEEIKKRRGETTAVQEAEGLAQGIDCERSELCENSSIHLEEAAHLYRDRGWVEMYSNLLDTKIYLVRDEKVKTPDT
ncbi:MAG: hypothetical protein HOB18_00765, partial [Nitrospina sp.]|nr:hypothetical protein [Nitrospina sp.]